MKFTATLFALLLTGVHGFTTAPSSSRSNLVFLAAESEVAVVDAPPSSASSGMRMHDVRRAVARMTKDNFVTTLESLEPFFLAEAGRTMYTKSMRRMTGRANALGMAVPAGYAKDAKTMQKRREKQTAFVQAKEQERLAAEEAAAAAASAAAETPAE
jgi:hypothetical protein